MNLREWLWNWLELDHNAHLKAKDHSCPCARCEHERAELLARMRRERLN